MNKYTILTVAIAAVILTACESLDEINRNPNATETPNPAYLLTGVQKNGADMYWGTSLGFGGTELFVQHWAAIQYTDADCYDFTNTDGLSTTLWNTGYTTLITNLNAILDMDESLAHSNFKAAALTMRSWVFLLMTDLYGDIPYSQVGKEVMPIYDSQQAVYEGIQTDLSQALSWFHTGSDPLTGDVMYNNDISKWRKLATSLKLRVALRIADRDSNKAKSIISALNLSEMLSSNDDTFQFIYTASPYNNPQQNHYLTRDDYRISKTIVDKLKALNDPRLPVYANKPTDPTVTTYEGGGNGLSNGDANSQGFAKISRTGDYFIRDNAPAVIYSYAELLFNLAEAVQRGYLTGNAADYYNRAIQASMQQFVLNGERLIEDAQITTYLAQSAVQYNASNWKQSIGEQKWIAFFGQGLDAFAEWRRLDYPVLIAGPASVLNGKLPVRVFYPGTEQSLNGANREAAVKSQGADDLLTKLWFDVN